jgi:hypothetical protein
VGMLKSFFDLTAMDDAVDEMVTALDTLSQDEYYLKIQGMSVPARFLARQTILADLNSYPEQDRAWKLQQILNLIDAAN